MTRLLVASTGGHLTELVLLAPRIWPPDPDERWVTFDSDQSRSLLARRNVHYVRDTPPRDWRSVLVNLRAARRLLDDGVDTVISNGAGIALSFLPLAQARGISAHYIECSARVEGLSMTGKLLQRVKGVHVYTQHNASADSRWLYTGSAFDAYRAVEVAKPTAVRRVFVTVGTMKFPFMALLNRLKRILPRSVDVVVQAGVDGNHLDWPGALVKSGMGYEEMQSSIAAADVVVAHAGIGSALEALDAGKVPLLVPRTSDMREHVDDHQMQIARHLERRGLAVIASSSTITLEDVERTLTRRVERTGIGGTFVLQ